MRRICIQWPRLGPYHLARLRATHAHFAARGIEVVALETAREDRTYAWQKETDDEPFRRLCVFEDAALDTLPPREVYREVTRTLDELQPDAVAINSYSMPDARACLSWCLRHERRAVVMTDSHFADAPRSPWREMLKEKIVGAFDAALVAGEPHRTYVEMLGIPREAIFTGYDVVDNAFFRSGADRARADIDAALDELALEATPPFFLASNRFIERKNLSMLLAAYDAYRSGSDAPWPLVLLGDGPLRERLEREAEAIGGVYFPGFRQIEELPLFYGLAGAFVHPAANDQWGLVVNEAMAAGLPVLVSTGAGSAHDLVHEGENGYRFEADDPAQLAQLLAEITSSADREMMGRRSAEIIADWTPDRFARQLYAAAEAAGTRVERRKSPLAPLLLWVLRHAARRTDSFHTVEA